MHSELLQRDQGVHDPTQELHDFSLLKKKKNF